MSWKIIYELFSGALGKSLLIVGLSTPVSFLISIGLNANSFKISLVGAILILVGYLCSTILTPSIIKNFRDGHEYAECLLNIPSSIDLVSEFKLLEENKATLPKGYDSYFVKQFEFKDINSAIELLGLEQSIRTLSIAKYNLVNSLNPRTVFFLMAVFIFGSLFTYLPLIHRVFIVLGA